MTKKKQHLKPDTVLKNYWRNNDRFADFFNAVLFQGKQVIKPDELQDLDTDESSVFEHRNYAESIQASRDNIKICKRSTTMETAFSMLGMESQEHIHYAMPIRVLGYDYNTYKKQYDNNAKKYKTAEGMNTDEYLSRMKKDDKFVPVITIVVYYGEQPWDGARSLHEMLVIPEGLASYVNDYKVFLVEARKNNLTLHNIDNVDLFNLMGFLLDQSKSSKEVKDKAIEYAREHQVDKSVIMTVAGATNNKINYAELNEKGRMDMCTVFEVTWEEGKAEGRTEGRTEGRAEGMAEGIIKGRASEIVEMGKEFGLSDFDILERLQNKLNISMREAQDCFNMLSKNFL